MNQTHQLRLLLEHTYTTHKRTNTPHAPSMWPFLAVPIKERLTLLALTEEATMAECKAAFPWMKETDHRLTSHRIHHALDLLTAAMEAPTTWINPGSLPDLEATDDLTNPETPFPIPDNQVPDDIDKQLRQALFSSVPLMLFGPLVPPTIHELGLQKRAIAYCLVVEEFGWSDIQMLFGCSEWHIRQTIKQAYEVLGGDEALAATIRQMGGK